ncbi:cyclin-H-like [Macrosteles quadrilineatus]|uniref:cyclin-H-like n=1 Tax=Macrosteles quadrilineatus TaxID=74068 RepID=UPI0023E2D762|nr:cyclin-H-like [Macrosteles quadrilineatus]
MYSSSTQRRAWTYKNVQQLERERQKSNSKYIMNFKDNKDLNDIALTAKEELMVIRHYEQGIRAFLQQFKPVKESLPREVKGTVFQLFKRFFTTTSVMEFHPNEMMITCIYLACKICEYMIPIDLFVESIEGDNKLLRFIIIDQELELLARINFNIHIVNPYHAVDGLMCQLNSCHKIHNPNRLQEYIYKFLGDMWHTDVCLLYAPSQIALAAVMFACSRCKENIDEFVMNTILKNPSKEQRNRIISVVRDIRTKVQAPRELPTTEEISSYETRINTCRSPHNNPSSEVFKRRMQEYILDNYSHPHSPSNTVSK